MGNVAEDFQGNWMPMDESESAAAGQHQCSECGHTENRTELPDHCPGCNAAMAIPSVVDEVVDGQLLVNVLPPVSIVELMRSSARPPGMRLDPLTRRPG